MAEGGPALVHETSGEIVPIEGAGLLIGRATTCSLRLPDGTVSKQHARVVKVAGGGIVLIDLGSTNGSYVNGVQVRTTPLSDGDHVRFGAVSFRFRSQASLASEPGAADRRLSGALETVRRFSSEALSLESERAVIRAATDLLLEILRADRVFVAFARDGKESPDLAMIRTRLDLDPKRAVAPVARTPMRQALRTRRTFSPSTVPADLEATSASMRSASLGSLVVVPLIARGRALGAVQIERIEGTFGAFDEIDVLVAEIVANLLAGSIETARLYKFVPREGERSAAIPARS